MKAFADIFRAKYGTKLAALRQAANVVGKIYPEKWDEFMMSQVMDILAEDDDLTEKFLDAAFADLVHELAIKPDPNYKPTERETAVCALADLITTLFK